LPDALYSLAFPLPSMLRFVAFATAFLLAVPVRAQAPGESSGRPAPTSPFFEFVRLADGVYAAHAASGLVTANAGVVDLGGGEALVFDATTTKAAAEDLARFAEWLSGGHVRYVVNSHGHFDHTGGNGAFGESALVIGTDASRAAMQASYAGVLADTLRGREVSRRSLAEYDSLLAAEVDPERRREWAYMRNTYQLATRRVYSDARGGLPALLFERRLSIAGPNRSVDLHEFRGGHTASDIVLHIPDADVAFVGDLLFVGRHAPLFLGDPDSLLAAHRGVLDLGVETVVPGHGTVGSRQDLEQFPAYVAAVAAVAREARETGRPADAVIGAAVPAPYRHLWWADMFFGPSVQAFYKRLSASAEEPADR
jgi:cyclase